MMANYSSVSTISDFRSLDEAEVLEGYLDGFSGLQPTHVPFSRSYMHGWRNGRIESGRVEADQPYISLKLAFEVI